MWPEMLRIIRLCRPRYVFAENVPGLLNSGYFGTIIKDLSQARYEEIKWCTLGADDVGAPHRRKRLWIFGEMADTPDSRRDFYKLQKQCAGDSECEIERTGAEITWWNQDPADLCHPSEPGLQNGGGSQVGQPKSEPKPERPDRKKTDLADTTGGRINRKLGNDTEKTGENGIRTNQSDSRNSEKADLAHPAGSGQLRKTELQNHETYSREGRGHDPQNQDKYGHGETGPVESGLGSIFNVLANRMGESGTFIKGPIPRVATGVRNRVSRLKALGNGQVPLCAAEAFKILTKETP